MCPIICDSIDYSPPGSSVHGILKARIFEQISCPPPGDLPHPGIQPTFLKSSALAGRFFTTSATCETPFVTRDQLWLTIDTWSLLNWRNEWQPKPVFLPGESYRQRSLADYSPCCGNEPRTGLSAWIHTHAHTHTQKNH